MSTKHTPGPWKIKPQRFAKWDAVSAYIVADTDKRKTIVAEVNKEVESWGDGNAYLIAAAPELLEALEKLCQSLEPFKKKDNEFLIEASNRWHADQRESVAHALAVLKKARGEL